MRGHGEPGGEYPWVLYRRYSIIGGAKWREMTLSASEGINGPVGFSDKLGRRMAPLLDAIGRLLLKFSHTRITVSRYLRYPTVTALAGIAVPSVQYITV